MHGDGHEREQRASTDPGVGVFGCATSPTGDTDSLPAVGVAGVVALRVVLLVGDRGLSDPVARLES